MSKTFRLFLFSSLVLMSACSSSEVKEQSIHVAPPDEPKAEAASPLEKLNIFSYFKQIHPNTPFEFQEAKDEYLKAKGENPTVFSLFKGTKSDLLIEQNTACYKTCQQQFKAYTFNNGALDQPVRFESLYPKQKMDQHLSKFKKKVAQSPTDQSPQSWIHLPKTGNTIDVLVVNSTAVYDAGALNWTGSKFEFKAYNSDLPSKTKHQDLR